jgi:hypothetical protein
MENKLSADVLERIKANANAYSINFTDSFLKATAYNTYIEAATAEYLTAQQKDKGPQGAVWVKSNIAKVLEWAEKFYSENGDQLMLDDNVWYITIEDDEESDLRNCKEVTADELAELYLMHHPDESATPDYQQLKFENDILKEQSAHILKISNLQKAAAIEAGKKYQQLKQKAEKMEALLQEIAASNCDYEDVNFKSLHNPYCRACTVKEKLEEWNAEVLNDQPKLTPEQIAERKEAIEWYRNPAGERQWKSAEIKPEHNVGVLVFIPGEDNHITSGMWDISNKWVLLDEYRTPEEEVTHWMPLPAFPEGYTWNEKKVAKDELENRHKANDQPKGKEVDK